MISLLKDRIESFDDYFPRRKDKCKLNYLKNWLDLLVDHHNKKIMS